MHVYTVIGANGELLDTRDIPASLNGVDRAVAWARRATDNDVHLFCGTAGAIACGAVIAAHLARIGGKIVDAPRFHAKIRPGAGESDLLDAARIGTRTSLRVLIAARGGAGGERAAKVFAFTDPSWAPLNYL